MSWIPLAQPEEVVEVMLVVPEIEFLTSCLLRWMVQELRKTYSLLVLPTDPKYWMKLLSDQVDLISSFIFHYLTSLPELVSSRQS
jgi:hypothetical protein